MNDELRLSHRVPRPSVLREKAWRFGAGPPVVGLGARELLDAYRAAGGADIGLAELRWWEIFGTLRWGIICLNQAWAHLSGAHRSVELAAIARPRAPVAILRT